MATGIQISSFQYVGAPPLNAVFGYYQAPSSVQIQQLQAVVQTAPVGGSLTIALITILGVELGRVIVPSAMFYGVATLETPVTLNAGQAVRAKVVGVDIGTASDVTLNLIGAVAQFPSGPSYCGPTSGCGPYGYGGSLACPPPAATMAFFPGTQGPVGLQGPAGPASTVPGPEGATGPFGTYEGDYVSTNLYYDSALRQSIVGYGGFFWAATNPLKNGFNSWEAPGTADWTNIGSTLINIATGWKLLASQEIPVGVNVVSPGFLKSDNFVDGTSGWVATGAGAFAAYDAIINGLVSTNTPKFNLASVTRTMPGTAFASTDIPTVASGDIPVYSDFIHGTDDEMIFYGWLSGTNAFVNHRFGNTDQKFWISVQGTGTQTTGGEQGYVLLHYRTRDNGGLWGAWTPITGQITYLNEDPLPQSFNNISPLSITLTGTQDIQFAASFAQSVYGVFDMDACTLAVLAFN